MIGIREKMRGWKMITFLILVLACKSLLLVCKSKNYEGDYSKIHNHNITKIKQGEIEKEGKKGGEGEKKEGRGREKGGKEKKKIYHCPMHPQYTSDKPGNCPICGMKLEPVEEGEKEEGDKEGEKVEREGIYFPYEKRQMFGVKFETVRFGELEKTVKAFANIDYVETKVRYISLKFSGWIEKLYVYTGKFVKRKERIFDIYSPEIVSLYEEYKTARGLGGEVLESVKRKLMLFDVPYLEKIEVIRSIPILSPSDGFIFENNIFEGMFVKSGDNLLKIVDTSTVWAYVEIFQDDLENFDEVYLDVPGAGKFKGKIDLIFPLSDKDKRTIKLRISIKNDGYRLKPGMFAYAFLKKRYGKRLIVPFGAVYFSGIKNYVFVDLGDGFIGLREVKIGKMGDDFVEILEGVSEGERIVSSANFIVDSETRIKEAIKFLGRSKDEKEKEGKEKKGEKGIEHLHH